MSDLLERLRKVEHGDRWGSDIDHVTNWYRNPDGPEAADEIERLQAERDRAVLTAMGRNTEIHSLQAVVDAAREKCVEIMAEYGNAHADMGKYDAADEILRALDGEVKHESNP
jgi:hypothetical protein